MESMSSSGLYEWVPDRPVYFLNGVPLGITLREFFVLNYDVFSNSDIEQITALAIGDSLTGGAPGSEWRIDRVR
jgi:hypothetical protein